MMDDDAIRDKAKSEQRINKRKSLFAFALRSLSKAKKSSKYNSTNKCSGIFMVYETMLERSRFAKCEDISDI